MSTQSVQATTSTSGACIVEEPSDADGVSERSASVGEQTRYSMAEMEAYIRLVQEDREQLQKEVQHLKDGVKALFNAMQKPVLDVQHLRSEHEQTRELVENIDKFKSEVTKSLSQLTVKCNTLDQHVPELREKLEQAIYTINTAQENMMAANAQSSPAPSEHSTHEMRMDTVEAIMSLREKARQMEAERTKKSRDMEALMMELNAIRSRMKEGIAANARHDALQPRLMSDKEEILAAVSHHRQGHVELGSEHVTLHIGLLAELVSFSTPKPGAAARAAARGVPPRAATYGDRSISATASQVPRARTPKSHKVDVSQEDNVSPAAPRAAARRRQSESGLKSTSMPTLGNPPKPKRKLNTMPRYEAVPKETVGRVEGTHSFSSAARSLTPTGTSRSTASRVFTRPATGPSAPTGMHSETPRMGPGAPAAASAARAVSAEARTGTTRAGPARGSVLDRLAKPKNPAEAAQRKTRSTIARASGIPRRSVDGKRADMRTSRGASVASSTTARSLSVASTARLSCTQTASDDWEESSAAALGGVDSEPCAGGGNSAMSFGDDSECSTKLLPPAGSTPTAAAAAAAVAPPPPPPPAAGPPQGRPTRLQPPRRAGVSPKLAGGTPEATGHSPSMSLSSTASVPNMSVYSDIHTHNPRVLNGLQPAESPGSPEFSSHSPISSSVQVRSFRQAVLSASQERGLPAAAVAEGVEPPAGDGAADVQREHSADSLRLNLEGITKANTPRRNGSGCSAGGDNSVRSWLKGEGRNGHEPEPILSAGLPNSLPTTGTTPRMEDRLPSSFETADTPPYVASGTPRTPKSKRQKSDGHTSPGASPNRKTFGPPLSPAKMSPSRGSPSKTNPSKTSPSKCSPRGGSPTKGSPGRRNSVGNMERRQSLSTLAPVIEEPAILPATIGNSRASGDGSAAAAAAAAQDAPAAAAAAALAKSAASTPGIRMTPSLDWLQSQAGSQKENQMRNRVMPAAAPSGGSSVPSKLRSFMSSAGKGPLDLEAQQRQARRAQQMFQPDNFSIDSKDSCKPEKCESPLKCPGDRAARNGQGTDPPLRPNAQLEERIAQLRSVKEDL